MLPVFLYAVAAAAAPQDGNLATSALTEGRPATASGVTTLKYNESTRNTTQDDVTTEFDESEPTTNPPETVTEVPERTTQSVKPVTSPRTTTVKSFSRASPRVISKLSYFNKASSLSGVGTNLVEKSAKDGKRKFKSRCRCEKIWNCPKLQITVPRCPDEYFLCCF